MLVVLLASCGNSKTETVNTVDTSKQEGNSEVLLANSSQEEAASISEIHKSPVWAKLLNATKETAAKKNMKLRFGDTVRTQGEALAQIDMKNGLAFRIGGDSVLTIQPGNKLYLKEGEMITWVEPGKKVPTQIVTPTATAGIRGTTVFIKTPTDSSQETEFFAWEGTVAVSLPNQSGEVILNSGEEVKVKKSDKNIEQIRRRVRKIPREEWQQRRQGSRLINKFARPLPTLAKIDQTKPLKPRDTAPIPPEKPQPRVRPEEPPIRRGESRSERIDRRIPSVGSEVPTIITPPQPSRIKPSPPPPPPTPVPSITPFKPEKSPEPLDIDSFLEEEETKSEKNINSIPINSIYCWIETKEQDSRELKEQTGIEHLVCPARYVKVETKPEKVGIKPEDEIIPTPNSSKDK